MLGDAAITGEAINNIAKHSSSTEVNIKLHQTKDEFIMQICDNGSGFEQDNKHTGSGLRNMKLRADRIGGKITFTENNGLTVILIMKRFV